LLQIESRGEAATEGGGRSDMMLEDVIGRRRVRRRDSPESENDEFVARILEIGVECVLQESITDEENLRDMMVQVSDCLPIYVSH
jgi:hypothetical protein